MTDIATLGIAVNTTQVSQATTQLGLLSGSAGGATRAIAALTAAFTSFQAVDKIVKFQDAMLGLKAVSSATTAEMVKLEKQARTLGATSVFSATQVGNAQKFLAQAGFDTNEVLKSTSATLKLASAGSLELATAADIASNVMGGMNLAVVDLDRVVDSLAQTARSSNTNITQLGSALSTAAPLASAAGVSLEEVSAAIGVLSDNAIQGERAGTGFGGILRQLSNVTPKAAAALADYGIKASEVDIQTQGLSSVLNTLGKVTISAGDAITIFGSEAAAAGLILGKNAERFDELTGKIQDSEGAAGDMAEVLSSQLSGSFKSLGSALEEAILQLGQGGLATAIESTTDNATALVSAFTGMLPIIAENNDLSAVYVKNMTFLADAIKAVGLGLTAAAAVAGTMLVITKGLTFATLALNLAMNANPWVLLARAVAVAAIGIGTYIGLTEDSTRATAENALTIQKSSAVYDQYGKIVGQVSEKLIDSEELVQRSIIASQKAQLEKTNTTIAQLQLEQMEVKKNTAAWLELEFIISSETLTRSLSIATIEQSGKRLKELALAYEKLFKPLDKIITGTGGLSKEQKALNKLVADGKKVFDDTRTPQEKYAERLKNIGVLLNADAISADTWGRAIVKATAALEDATGVTQENEEALRASEDALKEIHDQQQETFDAWSDNVSGLIAGTLDLDDVLKNLAKTLVQDAFINPLLISVGLGPNGSGGSVGGAGGAGSGGLGDIASIASSLFSSPNTALMDTFGSFASSGFGQSIGLSGGSGGMLDFTGGAGLTDTGAFLSDGIGTAGSLAGAAGGFAGSAIGDAFGYESGGIGNTVGAIAGNFLPLPPGVGSAVGAFVGSFLDDLFGGSNKTTDFKLLSEKAGNPDWEENVTSNAFGTVDFEIGSGHGKGQEISDALNPLLQTMSQLEQVIASTLDATQISNIKAGVANVDVITEDADETINSFVSGRLAVILEELDPAIKTLSNHADLVGAQALQYVSSLTLIAGALESGGPLIDLFGKDIASTAAFLDQIKSEDQTIAQAFAGLQQAQSSYYQNFFSEEERFETALNSAKAELDLFNESVGMSGAAYIDSKSELRDYIEALDLTTVAGREALESALGLQGALLFVASAADQAAEAALKQSKAELKQAEDDLKALEKINKAELKKAEADQKALDKASKAELKKLEDAQKALDKILESSVSGATKFVEKELGDMLKTAQKESDLLNKSANSVFSVLKNAISIQKDMAADVISGLSDIVDNATSSRQTLRASDSFFKALDFDRDRDIIKRAASGEVFSKEVLERALESVADPSEDLFSSFQDYQRAYATTSIDLDKIRKSAEISLTEEEASLQALEALEAHAQTQIDALNGVNNSVLSVDESIAALSVAISAANQGNANVGTATDNLNSIEALYEVGLGRQADQAGVDYWQTQLDSGMSFDEMRENFFKAAFENGENLSSSGGSAGTGTQGSDAPGAGTATGYSPIELLYYLGLNRSPDPAGVDYWQSQLDNGMSYEQIKSIFFQAAEENGEQNINAFANGGIHGGGMRIVGERGPELELTGPSRIINNSDLMSGLSKSDSNNESNGKMNMILSKMQLLIDRMYRQQQEWTADALNVRVVT